MAVVPTGFKESNSQNVELTDRLQTRQSPTNNPADVKVIENLAERKVIRPDVSL